MTLDDGGRSMHSKLRLIVGASGTVYVDIRRPDGGWFSNAAAGLTPAEVRRLIACLQSTQVAPR
jgi:hypothetical protein